MSYNDQEYGGYSPAPGPIDNQPSHMLYEQPSNPFTWIIIAVVVFLICPAWICGVLGIVFAVLAYVYTDRGDVGQAKTMLLLTKVCVIVDVAIGALACIGVCIYIFIMIIAAIANSA